MTARKPTKAQVNALAWLAKNGGLAVPNMNMAGRAREWPETRTLRCLIRDGLLDFDQREYEWSVRVNEKGAAVIATRDQPA